MSSLQASKRGPVAKNNPICEAAGAVAGTIDDTNYIGIDLHSNNIYVCVLHNAIDKSGRLVAKKLMSRRIPLEPGLEEVVQYLRPFVSVKHQACVESTYNWYGLADLFEDNGWNLVLADPTSVKKFKAKYTDDRTDAEFLADRLRLGDLRTSTIMPKQQRAFRDLVRHRMSLVQDRSHYSTILINMINNHQYLRVNRRQLQEAAATLVETGEITEPLKSLTVPLVGYKAMSYLKLIQLLSEEIDIVEQAIVEGDKLLPPHQQHYVSLLQRINGCGFALSYAISAEISDIKRFKNARNFVSYCRLAPTARFSNGKVKGEGNPKDGNAYLSWSLTELANLVVRFNPEAKYCFDKLLSHGGGLRVRAIRTMAAKLARAIFYMLRDHQRFNVEMLFGKLPTKVAERLQKEKLERLQARNARRAAKGRKEVALHVAARQQAAAAEPASSDTTAPPVTPAEESPAVQRTACPATADVWQPANSELAGTKEKAGDAMPATAAEPSAGPAPAGKESAEPVVLRKRSPGTRAARGLAMRKRAALLAALPVQGALPNLPEGSQPAVGG